MALHEIARVSHEPVRRTLHVVSKHAVTPGMLRVVFASPALQGWQSPAPDDHLKLLLPGGAKRSFTPRAFDPERNTLAIDFALHGAGPAVEWARGAAVGDALEIAGPRSSTVVPDDFAWYLLLGDATALPAMGRRLEGLREGVPVWAYALVADAGEQQRWATRAALEMRWLHGAAEGGAGPWLRALRRFVPPPGDGFVWIAAEASAARDLYSYTVDTLRQPRAWIKAAAYWRHGHADGGEKIT